MKRLLYREGVGLMIWLLIIAALWGWAWFGIGRYYQHRKIERRVDAIVKQ
jgi:hypothetical protein